MMQVDKMSEKCGLPQSQFVNPPSIQHLCGVCDKVLDDPRQCLKGHCFCLGCITSALETRKECPQCLTYLTVNHLSINLFAKNTIDSMIVRCSHSVSVETESEAATDGCMWTGALCDLVGHLESDCAHHQVECKHANCEETFQRQHLAAHENICVHRTVLCEYCNEQVRPERIDAHKSECTSRPMKCPACNDAVSVCDLSSHTANDCPMQYVDCPIALLSGNNCPRCNSQVCRRDLYAHLCGSPEYTVSTIQCLASSVRETRCQMELLTQSMAALFHSNQQLTARYNELSEYMQLCSVVIIVDTGDGNDGSGGSGNSGGGARYFFAYPTAGRLGALREWVYLLQPHRDVAAVRLLSSHIHQRGVGTRSAGSGGGSCYMDWEVHMSEFSSGNGGSDGGASGCTVVSPARQLSLGVVGYITMTLPPSTYGSPSNLGAEQQMTEFCCLAKGAHRGYDVMLSLLHFKTYSGAQCVSFSTVCQTIESGSFNHSTESIRFPNGVFTAGCDRVCVLVSFSLLCD